MFCYQCEQTDRSNPLAILNGCTGPVGNCGKDERTSDLQDVILHVCYGIGQYAKRLRDLGSPDPRFVREAGFYVFTTLTNVNFNPTRFVQMIAAATALRAEAKKAYEAAARAAGHEPQELRGAAQFVPATTLPELTAQALAVRVDAGLDVIGADTVGLRGLTLYGLKGTCAYAHHAHVLGHFSEETDTGIEDILDFLGDPPTEVAPLLAGALKVGEVNLHVLALLDGANGGVYGKPEPTTVRTTPVEGKAVLISGHDLGDLHALLTATEGTGINVYTHGEMLPCHGYPGLKKYAHLAGNFGGAWQDQFKDFAAFPGPIVMTSNCLIEPQPSYRNRIFTLGPVGWPGVRHLDHDSLGEVVAAARALPGFTAEDAAREETPLTTGFGHEAVLDQADTIVEAIKAGDISRFLVIGGCDGAVPGRNYYTEVADNAPKDTVLMTMGCNKYRFNSHEFGEIGGIPRLLDVGQCNDSYTAVKVALALAEAFDCGVNDLPLSLFVSWFEQKAAAVLLTLLHLGVRGIRLGPTLPAFLTPAALEILSEKFDLKPNGEATSDLAAAMAGN